MAEGGGEGEADVACCIVVWLMSCNVAVRFERSKATWRQDFVARGVDGGGAPLSLHHRACPKCLHNNLAQLILKPLFSEGYLREKKCVLQHGEKTKTVGGWCEIKSRVEIQSPLVKQCTLVQ